MDLRGQRFEVNLSDDEDEITNGSRLPSNAVPSLLSAFIGDIKERETSTPSAPKMKSTPTGFPEHKKRTRISAFKQQRGAKPLVADSPNAFALPKPSLQAPRPTNGSALTQNISSVDEERRLIDEENRQRLAAMSVEEIEEERRELMAGLNPSLIEKLLKRSNLDEGRGDTGIDPPMAAVGKNIPAQNDETTRVVEEDVLGTESSGAPLPNPAGKRIDTPKSVRFEHDAEPTEPIGLQSAAEAPESSEFADSVHFPSAPSVPDLDPSDPSFLETLHTKYFPNLPSDPSKLAWMAPLPTRGSVADQESPYYPENEALAASALRFDFRGGLLPPRISRALPVTKGLHHHGEAPEAAGYTVPELARLARSAFPAQRCVAFQTLGRLLYRLGRGEWGGPEGEITKGLWKSIEEGKAIQTLYEASSAEGGHQGSKTYAVEALWLWQKGGGKVWKAD